MDSPKQLPPSWAPGSSQMFPEEHFRKNLSKMTLDTSIKLPPSPEYPPQQQVRESKPQGLLTASQGNTDGVDCCCFFPVYHLSSPDRE
ncbi:unnamed protein product [Nyctereutes procyonoides]|uniref:(raccoon dog) hypothetical protein n=1 Tax=Nyctereutes procyonoides TaxID=34880 RepID=A0A811ZC58_NYCPR|nr:unnamed protein product [Nyctereutes procyonoides]